MSRVKDIIDLARQASSGNVLLARGGEPAPFEARRCFMFSAIKMPPFQTEDTAKEVRKLALGFSSFCGEAD